MAEFVAASAAVLMVPSIKGFQSRLKTELEKINETVKVGITLDKGAVSKVEAQVAAFKQAAEKGSVKTQLELDVKQAEARLTELRIKELARKLGLKVDLDTKQADLQLRLLRAEAEARAIKMRLEVDTDSVKKEFEKLTNGLGEAGAGFKKALTLNLQVIGLSQLPAVGLALASVTQSMVALGQSALLLPGILSGVASSFATLLVGVSGVKAAFTAYGTAVKDSAQDATRAKDATRALTNANRDLAAATRDAKRNQEDLNAQLRDAPLDEASALIEVKQARIDAANTFGKTGLDRQRDAIAVEKAESNLANTRTRNGRLAEDAARANKDGVAGNPAVLDALDRQTKAQEALNTASKGGTAIAAALKNLSPNAQDFVTKVESMRGSWTDFKKSIQDKLFAGLGDDVVALSGKLPVLEKGFTGIASALNNNVKTALKTLSSDQNVGFFDRIFGNTAAAQEKLSAALKPLIDGFVHLGAVGSDFLPRMVDGFAKLLERFNGFIDAADKDGRLKTWIETGIQAVKDLGNSFLNIVSIVGSVAEAFTGSGGQGFLGSLETGTKRLADFLKSADGQDKLQKFFHDARESFNEWLPIIKNIVDAIKNAFQASRDWSDQLRPFLSGTSSLLKEHTGLAQGILTAYLGWKTISPIIKGIKTLLDSDLLGAIKKVIAAVGEGEGFKGKLGALSGFMSGAFTTAAAALALFVANNFVTAFHEGEDALSRMKTKADELATSLDQVTGAATKASTAVVSNQFQNATNDTTQEKYGDLRQVAKDKGIDTGKLFNAIAQGDSATVDALLGPTKQVTRDAVEKSDFYKGHKDSLEKIGGLDTVVAALNGDQDAVKKYAAWADQNATQGGFGSKAPFPTAGLSHEAIRGLELSQALTVPGLDKVKAGLPQDVQSGVNLTGTAQEGLDKSKEGRLGVTGTNQDKNGKATLKPGNPFGSNATVGVTDSGGISVFVPGRANPTLEANVKAGGGDVDTTTVGGSTYTLDKTRAAIYANIVPAFASGGMASGAGSGTSDSILAKVSDGEFITRAAQVAKNPALFHGLNSGAIDPGSLPRFDGGGLASVSGQAQPPEPIIRPNGFLGGKRAGFGDSWNQIKNAKTGDIGGTNTWSLAGGYLGLDRLWGGSKGDAPAGPAPFTGGDTNAASGSHPLGVAKLGAKSVSGAPIGQPYGNPAWQAYWQANPDNAKGATTTPTGAVPAPATAPPSGPTGADLFGGPAGGPSHLDPTFAGPGPAGLPPGIDASTPLPAEQGYVPPVALSAVDGVVPSASPLDGLPANLQPLGILQQIGSVLLDAVLGFFGLNPAYINTLKQGLGLFGINPKKGLNGVINGQADPAAASLINGESAGAATPVADTSSVTAPVASAVAFKPGAGAEQWRPAVSSVLDQYGASYGVTAANKQKWEDAIVRQIQTESGGNPGADNPNDTNGRGGSQHVSGLLQYLPSTYAANNITGRPYMDPIGQIAGVLKRAPKNADGSPSTTAAAAIGQGHGWASGGMLSGPGSGTSDSILARVSHGEFITRAAQVAKNPGLFHGLNSGAIDPGSLPAFAIGGEAGGGLADVKRNPDGTIPTKSKGGGSWTPPKTVQPLPSVPKGDRGAIGAAPNEKHSLGAVDQGIDGAATAIGNAASIAASVGSLGAAGGGGLGSLISGATQIGSGVAKGLANIGSSLLVGTVTGGTTAGAYGSPVLPQKSQQEPQGPRIVNQYGDIHTASYDEFYKGQQRREQQQQAPYINSLRK